MSNNEKMSSFLAFSITKFYIVFFYCNAYILVLEEKKTTTLTLIINDINNLVPEKTIHFYSMVLLV